MKISVLCAILLILTSVASLSIIYWEIGFSGTCDYIWPIVNNRSVDECAIEWALEYNKLSIVNNREYASTIYKDGHAYKYTDVTVGDSRSVVPSSTNGVYNEVALIHSHAKASISKVEEYFSGSDYVYALDSNISIIYVSTPEGKLKKGEAFGKKYHSTTFGEWFSFITTAQTTTTIYTKLPHDSKALWQ